jgi:hypothetical protein
MTFSIYEYVDANGVNQMQPWVAGLQVRQRAGLDSILDKLHLNGEAMRPTMLAGTAEPGISKLRIHGNVQLRPLLCTGPVSIAVEFTLLHGATEVGGKIKPKGAEGAAAIRKTEVAADPTNRRAINGNYP